MLEKICKYISEELLMGAEITASTSLIESGYLDSFAVLRLIDFLESEFAIEVQSNDFSPENFDSVNQIIAFVNEMRG